MKLKKINYFIVVMLLLGLTTGCFDSKNKPVIKPNKPKEVKDKNSISNSKDSESSKDKADIIKYNDKDDRFNEYIKDCPTYMADFGIELTKRYLNNKDFKEQNILISPLSIYSALGMTASGASGDTLVEMEKTLGVNINLFSGYFKNYTEMMKKRKNNTLKIANSIWVNSKDNEVLNEDFKSSIKKNYNADIFSLLFNNDFVIKVNDWVKTNTDGLIDKILNRADKNAKMYIVNALKFESAWKKQYKKNQIKKDKFYSENGKVSKIDFLCSTEYGYIATDTAIGIRKSYRDGKMFIALLPKKNKTIQDVLNTLNGKKLLYYITNIRKYDVETMIPKFKFKFETSLKKDLFSMGMKKSFGSNANFSKMLKSKTGVFINDVIHKTYIELDENGTKAAAVTAVEMLKSACLERLDVRKVNFNRPFIYMIYDFDKNTKVPIFLGVIRNLDK
ncbi:MAG: serine protease [Clostridiales bacterium]|nr:MAG: serine protease [Clostridiales bacterium]